MSNEAPFDGQSQESLQALAKVVQICLPAWPCHRKDCERCVQRIREDELEERIWNGA